MWFREKGERTEGSAVPLIGNQTADGAVSSVVFDASEHTFSECMSSTYGGLKTCALYSDATFELVMIGTALAVALVLFVYRRPIALGFYWAVVSVAGFVVGNARLIAGRFRQDVNEHTPR
jgi:hypothetical protein